MSPIKSKGATGMEIPKKKVRLYSLSTCPACKSVKKFLEEQNVEFEQIDVDLLDSGEQWVTSKEIKRYNPFGCELTFRLESSASRVS